MKEKYPIINGKKICSICQFIKPVSEFVKRLPNKVRSYCKKCANEYNKRNYKKYPLKNKWIRHYYSAKRRCEIPFQYGYKRYGGRGIKFFLTKEDVKYLWKRDCANEMEKPSIDRINSNGHYTLENCRFVEFRKNAAWSKGLKFNGRPSKKNLILQKI